MKIAKLQFYVCSHTKSAYITNRLKYVGSVAGPGSRGVISWEQDPAWPRFKKGKGCPSLQRYPRYPRSQVSIRPLALPTIVRGIKQIKFTR